MCDGILTKFKLIQALLVVLIVCKNEEDPYKTERNIARSEQSSHTPGGSHQRF